jgi:hypothetical protein
VPLWISGWAQTGAADAIENASKPASGRIFMIGLLGRPKVVHRVRPNKRFLLRRVGCGGSCDDYVRAKPCRRVGRRVRTTRSPRGVPRCCREAVEDRYR